MKLIARVVLACAIASLPGGVDATPGGTSLSIGKPTVQGSLEAAAVDPYVKRREAAILECFTRELAKKPQLAGTLKVSFRIDTLGAVSQASASGVDSKVGECVARTIKAIAFPKPKSGTAQVTYQMVFKNRR
jgi:hypothetical protein